MAEALYRKYRPQVFEDVVGQEPIERTLKNAISQDKVSHAYLFCGPRGTGKTTTARLLAKALLCEHGPTPDPDGTCEDCQLVADGAHPDVYELDAASRTGVENVREEIISRVHFAPTRGRWKVYIIDEVHMLSTAAFNALLKTLEEPPAHVVFILCTTDPQKVPETIHSRCQRFDFHRISPESMVARLGAICMAEEVEFEGEALDLIAQRAGGGLRDALTSLEQIIAFENGKVTLAGAERLLGSIDSNDLAEIMAYVGKRDIANCFRWTAAFVETGADLAHFVRDMAEHVRDLYIMTLVGDDAELDVSETARRQLAGELAWFGSDRASRLLGVLGDLMAELKTTSNPRLAFEIALTRMVRPDSDLTLESLAERVEALESGYSSVAHVLPGTPLAASQMGGLSEFAGDAGVQRGDLSESAGDAVSRESGKSSLGDGGVRGFVGDDSPKSREAASPAGSAVSMAGGLGQDAPSAAPNPSAVANNAEHPAASEQHSADLPPTEPEQNNANELVGDPRQDSAGDLAGNPGWVDAGEPMGGPARNNAGEPVGDLERDNRAVGAHLDATASDTGMDNARPDQTITASAPSATANGASKMDALANPAALQRIWQAVLADVKRQKAAYGVLFMGSKTEFDSAAGRINVIFPAESSFAFNAVQKPDVQDVLAAALQKAVGEPTPFAFLREGDAPAQPAQPTQPTASATQPTNPNTPPDVGPHAAGAHLDAPAEQVTPSASSQQPVPTQPPAEQPPYEQVPYEDIPYEPVPYEEIDAGTAASPSDNRGPSGALEEDTAALQALLQASFGEGVILSETDE